MAEISCLSSATLQTEQRLRLSFAESFSPLHWLKSSAPTVAFHAPAALPRLLCCSSVAPVTPLTAESSSSSNDNNGDDNVWSKRSSTSGVNPRWKTRNGGLPNQTPGREEGGRKDRMPRNGRSSNPTSRGGSSSGSSSRRSETPGEQRGRQEGSGGDRNGRSSNPIRGGKTLGRQGVGNRYGRSSNSSRGGEILGRQEGGRNGHFSNPRRDSESPDETLDGTLDETLNGALDETLEQEEGYGNGTPPRSRHKERAPTRKLILRPPLDDNELAERILSSPQLALKSFPLLSSCLPPAPLRSADFEWMEQNLPALKASLGYPLPGMTDEELPEESPIRHVDTLLYLAFQHEDTERYQRAHYVRKGHTRLGFLGQYILELALAELFLQVHPRELPASLRERSFKLTNKRVLPRWIRVASMDRLIFPHNEDMDLLKADVRTKGVKTVFWALIGAAYLTLGMGEVYRILFEVFKITPDDKAFQPLPRVQRDEDYVSPELEQQLTWQDVAAYKPPPDSLFAKPRLYRACVPPGMHRFRGNIWEINGLPKVMQALGYPLGTTGENPEIASTRNAELELGLQLCFTHPSLYKFDHPRFCYERLEYIGSTIQDVVMAEHLLMKYLDYPGKWLEERHRRLLFNRLCGRHLRAKKLHPHIMFGEERKEVFEKSRRLKNFTTTAVQQAVHGLGYLVYGKAEARRLMFDVFDFEQVQPPPTVR